MRWKIKFPKNSCKARDLEWGDLFCFNYEQDDFTYFACGDGRYICVMLPDEHVETTHVQEFDDPNLVVYKEKY